MRYHIPLQLKLLLISCSYCCLIPYSEGFGTVANSLHHHVGLRRQCALDTLVVLHDNAKSESTETPADASVGTVEGSSKLLLEWDRAYNPESQGYDSTINTDDLQKLVPSAVRLLSSKATEERNIDSTTGRCMLGICASSAGEGVETLKSWVTALELPRGLLHGMDKDGVPLELDGGVYIKYNSGGVYSFADIRKSGMGFDALWKPGDALLEPYDGKYRGVYFQVELADGEFRQYLIPLDIFL